METKTVGLYVHIPFCKRKCNYCDFCSVSDADKYYGQYIENLCLEIKSYKREPKIALDSIFFGGGTPSLLLPLDFEKIVKAIKKSFIVLENAEFTVEINPATVNSEKIAAYKSAGVNRISIGVQSIHENELKKLGRIHSYNDFLDTYKMLRDGGIGNINVDLMYGIPNQTSDSFAETLKSIASLSVEHISCYGLIIEEGTPFFRDAAKLALPGEDEEYAMYDSAFNILTGLGYNQYEISNYAKRGYECRHNLKYWKNEEYIGVGIAAHSYFDGVRFGATESFFEYFDGYGEKYRKVESGRRQLDPFEYAMLALRLSCGMNLCEYKRLFGRDFLSGKEELVKRFADMGLIKLDGNRLSLTHKGFYVSNSILSELL